MTASESTPASLAAPPCSAFDANRQAEIARLTAALAGENARCRALEAAIIKWVDTWRKDALTNEECARKPDGLAYRGRADAFRSCARELESALAGAQNEGGCAVEERPLSQ